MTDGIDVDTWQPTRGQCRAAIPAARDAEAKAREIYRESIAALVKAKAHHRKSLDELREVQQILGELLRAGGE
jgi:hypothetical protein